MSDVAGRRLAYAALLLLYLLHNDLWYWDDPRVVMGLPVGLTYHVGLSVAASLVMLLVVRFAWPHDLEVLEETPPAGAAARPGRTGPAASQGPGRTDGSRAGAGSGASRGPGGTQESRGHAVPETSRNPGGTQESRGHAVPETSRGDGDRSPEGSGEPR